MSVCKSDSYKSLIKLSNCMSTLLCSFESLDYNFFNSFFLSIDKKNYDKIIVIIKESYLDCYDSNHTNALQILSILNNKNITIKVVPNLNFSGILINNSNLFIPEYNSEKNIENLILSNEKNIIKSFKNKFNNILLNTNSFNHFYKCMLDKYISNSLDINNKIETYISNVKLNNYDYKNSQFYYDPQIKLTSYQVTQFSDFNKGVYNLPVLLKNRNNIGYTYKEVGEILLGPGKKDGAYSKYGENHSKLAESLGLIYITYKPKHVFLSDLGIKFINLSDNDKKLFLKYQIYNMPLIKIILNTCFYQRINLVDLIMDKSELSLSTAKRRSSNVKTLIEILEDDCSENIYNILNNSFLNKKNTTKTTTINPFNPEYLISLEEKNKLFNLINKKLNSNNNYFSIKLIFNSIKLHIPDLLKRNNINDSIKFSAFLQINFNNYYNIFDDIISYKNITITDPFIYFINKNHIIYRKDISLFLLNCGYNEQKINNTINNHVDDLIRLDFDTYILKSKFNLNIESINEIKNCITNKLNNSIFFSLFNYSDLINLPNIGFNYNQYILFSIITNYLDNDFNIIYKSSNTTNKYNYILIVLNDSIISDFTDVLINIISTYFSEFNYINFDDLSSYLLINNICDSLRQSFIDKQKISIDNLKRLEILN